jgi:hypothetical protein
MLKLNKKMKKAYFYTLDVALAMVILIVGLIIIAAIYFYTPQKEKTEALSNDITGLLASTRVGDLCEDISTCRCTYPALIGLCTGAGGQSKIRNNQETLLELFGQLYHDHERLAIESLVNETLRENSIIPQSYDIQIMLYDPQNPGQAEQLYPLVP